MATPEYAELHELAEKNGVPFFATLEQFTLCKKFAEAVPINLARSHGVIGVTDTDGKAWLLVADSRGRDSLSVFCRLVPSVQQWGVVSKAEVNQAIDRVYANRDSATAAIIEQLQFGDLSEEASEFVERHDLLGNEATTPVINLVNSAILDAIRNRASDIHFQPYEETLVIRFRIDGVLFDMYSVPRTLQEEVLSRLKIIGRMNIAEKRLPQDGRASVRLGARLVDLRIASLPTSHGERIVVRLLDKGARLYSLAELGMQAEVYQPFKRIVQLEHGLVLVTGPTGGGKSTTLYAALQEINTKDRNVVTLEDPIEYQLNGISQTQVNEKKGLTFATGLRNVLRQDPDIIMVGEIRDEETAEMAIQSSLTGHMVFSTLHTNDAASAMTRLLDLHIEPYLVASSVVAVLAQRLVRKICAACAVAAPFQEEWYQEFGLHGTLESESQAQRGIGCAQCRGTGFHGRIGLFELLLIDEEIQTQIQTRANAAEIRRTARKRGMKLLVEDGLQKVKNGKTTIEEVRRVSMKVFAA